jgi:hypothetical protein
VASDAFNFGSTSANVAQTISGGARPEVMIDNARWWLNASSVLLGLAILVQFLRLVLLPFNDGTAGDYVASLIAVAVLGTLAGLMILASFNFKNRHGKVIIILAGVAACLMGGCAVLMGGPLFLIILFSMMQGKARRVSGGQTNTRPVSMSLPVLLVAVITGISGFVNVMAGFKTFKTIMNPDVAQSFDRDQ